MADPSRSASKNKESKKGMAKKSQVVDNGNQAKRRKCPGVRVIGGRIYDSEKGKTCHQCRQKTMDFSASCKSQKERKQCTITFCHRCLLNRYGEQAEDVAVLDDWKCPKCRGICNCSFCMKKRGHRPTGPLVHTAKATGFSSVSDLLHVKCPDGIVHDQIVEDTGVSPKKPATLKKGSLAASPSKPGKENSFDGKTYSDFNSWNMTPNSNEKKSKKMKRKGLKEICNGNRDDDDDDDDARLRKSTPKRPRTSEEISTSMEGASSSKKPKNFERISKKEVKKNEKDGGKFSEKKNSKSQVLKNVSLDPTRKEEKDGANCKDAGVSNGNISERMSKKEAETREKDRGNFIKKKNSKSQVLKNVSLVPAKKEENGANCKDAGVSNVTINDDAEVKLKVAIESYKVKKCTTELQNKEAVADIQVPQGARLMNVAGLELAPEDVGHALQFLEFCAAFGKVLDLKKGQAESVIREMMYSRSRRQKQYSSIVQIHIKLLSLIQEDMEKGSLSLSPTSCKNSWLQALGKCVSESQCALKEFSSDCFVRSGCGYEKLDTSEKLKLLNFLCDEALGTTALRSWIDDQNSKFVEREKEAREKVVAAKDKEKHLKRMLQDEVAKAIVAKNGAPLSISEHEAIVSKIKSEAAQAHAEMLEAMGMVPQKRQRSDAVRTEPILLDVDGHAFWKLKGYTGEPDILLQDMEKRDAVAPNEKWFAFDAEQKEAIGNYISSLRAKRRWV